MKLVTGGLLLLAAEQAFAHAHMLQFPHRDVAASYLIPASVVFLALGSLLLFWGLITETRGGSAKPGPTVPSTQRV